MCTRTPSETPGSLPKKESGLWDGQTLGPPREEKGGTLYPNHLGITTSLRSEGSQLLAHELHCPIESPQQHCKRMSLSAVQRVEVTCL